MKYWGDVLLLIKLKTWILGKVLIYRIKSNKQKKKMKLYCTTLKTLHNDRKGYNGSRYTDSLNLQRHTFPWKKKCRKQGNGISAHVVTAWWCTCQCFQTNNNNNNVNNVNISLRLIHTNKPARWPEWNGAIATELHCRQTLWIPSVLTELTLYRPRNYTIR